MRESDTDCIPEAERGNNLSGAEGMRWLCANQEVSGLGQQTVSTNSFSLPIPQLPPLPLSFCQWREAITGDSNVVNFVSDSARLGGPLYVAPPCFYSVT